jgi:hypothetical protein
MTNTITNITQCSPLQCLEELVTGQSVPGEQGVDGYTACQCGDVLQLNSIVPSLMLTYFSREGDDGLPKDPRFKEVVRDIKNRFEVAYMKRDAGGRPETLKAYTSLGQELVKKAIGPMTVAIRAAPGDASLQSDYSLVFALYGDLLKQADSPYIAKYAYTEAANHLVSAAVKGGDDRPSDPVIDRYVELMEKALDVSRDSFSVSLMNDAKKSCLTAAKNLYKWGHQEKAQGLREKANEIGVDATVLEWMQAYTAWLPPVEGASDNALRIKRFKETLDAVKDVLELKSSKINKSFERDPGKVISYIERKRLYKAIKGLVSQYLADGSKEVAAQIAMTYRELSIIYNRQAGFGDAGEQRWLKLAFTAKMKEAEFWGKAGIPGAEFKDIRRAQALAASCGMRLASKQALDAFNARRKRESALGRDGKGEGRKGLVGRKGVR